MYAFDSFIFVGYPLFLHHDESRTQICAAASQRRLTQMFVMLSDRRERSLP